MQKIVDSKAIIRFFYSVTKKRHVIDGNTIKNANVLIDKFNKHNSFYGDRYLSDQMKKISSDADFAVWEKVFRHAKYKLLKTDIDERLLHNVLNNENYIKESLRVHLSPSRFYEREKTIFNTISKYIYYFNIVEPIE